MKPHVIMHMATTLDGRIVTRTWPKDVADSLNDTYERLHTELKGEGWIIGRVSMAEFAKGEPIPAVATETYPRTTWKSPSALTGPYAIALDPSSKLHLNRSTANDDPIVVVLTETTTDDHLAELRRDGISYIFGGEREINLERALEVLQREFGIKRLLLEGGGGINGAFLTAGLIDEISLVLVPLADGTPGPAVFDRADAPAHRLEFIKSRTLEGGMLHLEYRVVNS